MAIIDIVGRLLLAAACSAVIGFEREAARKSAGLRTHILVGVGSATFSIVSIIGFEGPDESRIAAQIVTGVGFLGAGAIFRDRGSVTGLTTAAGLWAVAAVGMAAGSGSFELAIISTIVIALVLVTLRRADEAVRRDREPAKPQLEITLGDPSALASLNKFCRKADADMEQVEFKRVDDGKALLTVAVSSDKVDMISEIVASHRSVESVERLPALFWKHPTTD